LDDIARGAYVLRRPIDEHVVLLATGSEVALALAAADLLAADGIGARVVSMPCWEAFERQRESWRRAVIPRDLPRLAIEAGSTGLWWRWVGERGDVIGLDRFGESGPAARLFEHFGLVAPRVAQQAKRLVTRYRGQLS
jgi:transketolase